MTKKPIIFTGVLVAIIIGLIVWKITSVDKGQAGKRKRGEKKPVAVEVVPVGRGKIQDRRLFTGTLKPLFKFDITPKITAQLVRMDLNIGDKVSSGELIALLDDDEHRLAKDQEEAALDVSKSQLDAEKKKLDYAKSKFVRSKGLFDKDAISKSQFEQDETNWKTAQANYQVAKSQVKQKQAELRTAQVKLGYCTLSVPRDTKSKIYHVAKIYVDRGALVDPKTPILHLVDINTLLAEIFIIERDYAKLRLGMKATLHTDAYPERTFPAVVTRISPVLDSSSRQASVELTVPNSQLTLKPGMFIRAEIVFANKENATTVPFDALYSRNGRLGVFKIKPDGKTADFIPVKTGIRDSNVVEIVSPAGLTGRVVTVGGYLLGSTGGAVIIFNPEKQIRKTGKRGDYAKKGGR